MGTTYYINLIGTLVHKYMTDYNICCASIPIAQAILESGWGSSTLAANYHNHHGMKCGSSWTGKSVNLTTKEEYSAGTLTTIKDNFRVYDNDDAGVKGYFEFLQYSRYSNLKGVTDYKEFAQLIKDDGWATSSSYVTNLINLVETYDLTTWDSGENVYQAILNAESDDDSDLNDTSISYDVAAIALEVYQGKWGNGNERKVRLTEAGYDYNVIQAYVNKVYYGIG